MKRRYGTWYNHFDLILWHFLSYQTSRNRSQDQKLAELSASDWFPGDFCLGTLYGQIKSCLYWLYYCRICKALPQKNWNAPPAVPFCLLWASISLRWLCISKTILSPSPCLIHKQTKWESPFPAPPHLVAKSTFYYLPLPPSFAI